MMRKLASGAGMYAFALLAPRVLRLVLVPLVVAAVGFEAYGVYVLLGLVLPFALIASDGGSGAAMLRLSPHEAAPERARLLGSFQAYRLATALALAFAIVALRAPLTRLLVGASADPGLLVYVAATVVAAGVLTAANDQLRSEDRHALVAGSAATRDVIEAVATLLLVVVGRAGLPGLFLGHLLADAVVALFLANRCRASLGRPHASAIPRLLRLGAPLAVLSFLVSFREVDRYLVKVVLGVAQAGRYDLALRIVGPVALGNAALAMVLEPYIYKTYADPGAGAAIASFLRMYVALFSIVAFTLGVISPEIFPLLSRDPDVRAAIIAPSLVFAFVGEGIQRVAGIGADFAQRTAVWMLVALVHLAVALPATYFLLPLLGLFAAGAALVCGTVVSALVAHALARRLFPLELPVARSVTVVVIGTALATALVGGAGPIAPLAVRLCAIVVFVLLVRAMVGLPIEQVRALMRAPKEEPPAVTPR